MLLTIFTPTYNRKELLRRVYKSLVNQTCHEFIWLIVDDGSSDGTKEEVDSFISENRLNIKYYYRENGGKMRAHNTGSSLCETELFVCLDSDDILAEDSVETIIEIWKNVEAENKKDDYAGIVAYKGEISNGKVREFGGNLFPVLAIKGVKTTLSGLYRKGFKGETTLVYRTKLLQKYPFPEIDGEKYVPEDYIYDKIDRERPLIILPKVLTICELVEGGYTDQAVKLRKNNPTGWFLYYEQRMQNEPWSVLKIKYISHYIRFCQVLGKKPVIPFHWKLVALPGTILLKLADKT